MYAFSASEVRRPLLDALRSTPPILGQPSAVNPHGSRDALETFASMYATHGTDMHRILRCVSQYAGIVSFHAASESHETSYVKRLLPRRDCRLTQDVEFFQVGWLAGQSYSSPAVREADERKSGSSPAPGSFNPSLDGGLPLFELFNSSRSSSSAIRAFKAAFLALNSAPRTWFSNRRCPCR